MDKMINIQWQIFFHLNGDCKKQKASLKIGTDFDKVG